MRRGFKIISHAEELLLSISALYKWLRSRITTFRDDFIKTRVWQRGFTLIELLVVVLIIGILAAVALPQYQTAVDKAHMARLIPMARNIADAQQRYYLANGELADKVEDLDLGFPAEDIYDCNQGGRKTQCIHFGEDYCSIDSGSRYAYCRVTAADAQYGIALTQALERSLGRVGCIGDSERGYKLCLSLGGKYNNSLEGRRYYSLQ